MAASKQEIIDKLKCSCASVLKPLKKKGNEKEGGVK